MSLKDKAFMFLSKMEYSPEETGLWEIYATKGTLLDKVTGSYVNAIEYALELKDFVTEHSIGYLKKIHPSIPNNVDVIMNNRRRVEELTEEAIKLNRRLVEIQAEIKKLS